MILSIKKILFVCSVLCTKNRKVKHKIFSLGFALLIANLFCTVQYSELQMCRWLFVFPSNYFRNKSFVLFVALQTFLYCSATAHISTEHSPADPETHCPSHPPQRFPSFPLSALSPVLSSRWSALILPFLDHCYFDRSWI